MNRSASHPIHAKAGVRVRGAATGVAGLVLVALAYLGGCAGTPQRSGGPVDRAEPRENVATTRSDLTPEVLYPLLVAEFAGQRGQLDLAVRTYLEVAHRVPDAKVAARATRVALYAKEHDAAREAARLWVRRAPRDPEAGQLLGVLLLDAGQEQEALSQLRRALAIEGVDRGEMLRTIAAFLSNQPDQEAALRVMKQLVADRPDDADALFAYALLALKADRIETARSAMEKALKAAPFNLAMATAYLGMLQKQGDIEAALAWLGRTVEANPGERDLRIVYGRLLADNRRFADARVQFESLAREQPEDVDVRFALGLLYLQNDEVEKAKECFMRIVETGSYTDEAGYYLGQIAETDKDYPTALRWYRSVGGGRFHFDAQLGIGLTLAKQGSVAAAQRHVSSLTPSNEDQRLRAVRVEGEILTQQARYREAMSLYDRALAGRYDTELLYTRAMLGEKMGRIDLLERDLRAILAREPNNAQALNALGYSLADSTTRYEEAYALIKRALELSPGDFFVLDSMGWVLYRLGRLDQAEGYLRRALRLRNDPEVAAHLGEVLWIKGDREGAREVWEEALQTSPGDRNVREVIQRLAP